MIVAVGPLLAGGGIDLAAAAQATLGSIVFANLLLFFPGLPWGIVAIIALLVGAVFGIINAFLINKLNFAAFIATIATATIYQGATQGWTGMYEVMVINESLMSLGRLTILNDWVPFLFVVMLVIVAIYVYIMANTQFGRSIYMAGGNQAATRLAGLEPKRIRTILYINSGVMSVFAGLAWVTLNRMGHPTAIMTNMPNFVALTAVIIGGVSFNGGSGTLAAGFFGLVVVRLFDNGLMIIGAPSYINIAAQGLILIVALIIDHINTVRQRRAIAANAMSYSKAK